MWAGAEFTFQLAHPTVGRVWLVAGARRPHSPLDDEPGNDAVKRRMIVPSGLDQFEEVFTLAQTDKEMFIALLKYPSPYLRLMLTIRSDFYDTLLPYWESELREATFTLAQPSQIAILEMVKRPAEVSGLVFEEGLA